MATREIWQGEGGDWFSKDEYGNVFDQSGGMVGNDAPTPALGGPPPGYQGGVGPNGAWSLAGPFQVEGSNAQGPYSYQSPGFPTQYQTPFNSPFSGGGGGGAAAPSGVGVQPGIDWAKLDLDRQKLAAEIQHNQQYLSYLQQQLAQQAKTDAERIAIEHERVGIERQLAGLQQQKFELEKQMDEFQRGMAIQQTIANPRNFVQSLMLMGASPTQAAGYLQSLPVVQQLGAAPGQGAVGGWAPPAGGVDLNAMVQNLGNVPSWQQILQSQTASSGGAIDPATGRNALFPFITGRKLPVQQTLSDLQSNNPRAGVIASLASFSGQDPNAFYGEFDQFLPKGGTLAPASVK
jgi:hypothetical protein